MTRRPPGRRRFPIGISLVLVAAGCSLAAVEASPAAESGADSGGDASRPPPGDAGEEQPDQDRRSDVSGPSPDTGSAGSAPDARNPPSEDAGNPPPEDAGGPWLEDVGNPPARSQAPPCDLDGDGRTDRVVYDRRKQGLWSVLLSGGGAARSLQLGGLGGEPVCADFHGDGRATLAVQTPEVGQWQIRRSLDDATQQATQYGFAPARAMPADFDGDGRADVAVYDPSQPRWYIFGSSAGHREVALGQPGDEPVPGDYDGDGRVDPAVWHGADGRWVAELSGGGQLQTVLGAAPEEPVPGDYDGDGRTDPAVFRADGGRWTIQGSSAGALSFEFGYPGTWPTPGDYDGDGRTDRGVYDPVSRIWYTATSSGEYHELEVGAAGGFAVPLPGYRPPPRHAILEGGEGFLWKPESHLVLLPSRMRQCPRPGGSSPVTRVVVARDPAGRHPMRELTIPQDADAEDCTGEINFDDRPKWRYYDYDPAHFGDRFFVVAFFGDQLSVQPYYILRGQDRQE